MTFDDIKRAVKGHCNLQQQESDTRVGESINRHHRRITAELGLETTRFVTRTVTTTNGVSAVEFTEIEKIDRILDTTNSSAIRLLQEVSIHAMRAAQPTTSAPCSWAAQESGSASVTVLLDTLPQSTYTLQADGWTTLADLQGNDSPAFPESFHDILTWYVIAEESLKKEKLNIAAAFEKKADKLLSELRHFLADSPTRDSRQGSAFSTLASAGGSSGSGSLGATAYTQSALVTFDRGASTAPFAVAQATAAMVANLDADKLDGEEGSYYLDRANHSGTLSVVVGDITAILTDRLLGRDSTGTGTGELIALDSTLEFTGVGTIRRAALTGDVTASAGSNALTIASDAVTDAKLRESGACSVIGRSANTTGNPADISASTNNTILARIGNALSWVAGLVFDGAGRITQVAFAASQSASSDANTLDDYEEGTWTPIDSSGASLSLSSTEGTYIKIGQLVIASAFVTYPSTGDTSSAVIGGFPFAFQNTTNDIFSGLVLNASGSAIAVLGVHNTTTAQVRNPLSFSPYTNANLSTLTQRFTITYRATA